MASRQLCRRPPPRWRQRLQGSSSGRRRRSRWPAWRRTPPPPSQRYTLLTASLQSAQKHGVGFPACQGQPGGGHRRPLLRDVHPCLAASSQPFWKHVTGFAFCQGSCNITGGISRPAKGPCCQQNINTGLPSIVVPFWTLRRLSAPACRVWPGRIPEIDCRILILQLSFSCLAWAHN